MINKNRKAGDVIEFGRGGDWCVGTLISGLSTYNKREGYYLMVSRAKYFVQTRYVRDLSPVSKAIIYMAALNIKAFAVGRRSTTDDTICLITKDSDWAIKLKAAFGKPHLSYSPNGAQYCEYEVPKEGSDKLLGTIVVVSTSRNTGIHFHNAG